MADLDPARESDVSRVVVHINGEEPEIVGRCCSGFALQHFYEDGQITDQVNVAYFRFDDQWHRLCFECATVFWRVSEAPQPATNSGLDHGLLLNDLSDMTSVVGQTVESICYSGTEPGHVRAVIAFSNGHSLAFAHDCEIDATTLVVV